MFTNERAPVLRTTPVTLEQQLQNLVDMRKRKQGQVRTLEWAVEIVQAELGKNFEQLETVELDQKKDKEGQIRALKWMERVIQNQLRRELKELETIREAIEEMA